MVPFPEAGRGRCRLLALILATMASIWVPLRLPLFPSGSRCAGPFELARVFRPRPAGVDHRGEHVFSRLLERRHQPERRDSPDALVEGRRIVADGARGPVHECRWQRARTAASTADGAGYRMPVVSLRQVANRAALTRQSPRGFEDLCREPSEHPRQFLVDAEREA